MNKQVLENLAIRARLQPEAIAVLLQLNEGVDPAAEEIMRQAVADYEQDVNFDYEGYRSRLENFENADGLIMLYVFRLAEHLHTLYLESGRGEEMFENLLRDFGAKVKECYDYTGEWGIRVAKWYNRWFNLERIALKRLQFEVRLFGDTYAGLTPEDLAINVHIPSIGPLDEATCEADYLAAAEFFGDRFEKRIPFMCHTWLLNPQHPDFLPPHSRLRPFQAKYDIFKFEEHTNFLWRLFGTEYNGDPHSLTERNSLERAYKAHILAGGKVGEGKGVFFITK